MGNKRQFNYLVIFYTIFSSIYFIWRIFYTIPFEYGRLSLISSVVLLFFELVGTLEFLVHFFNISNLELPKRPQIDDKTLFPHVDVFIATYNEPTKLLYKTINGCLNMEYPDKSKVHIYVCDDGRRVKVRELCNKMGINYIYRDNNKDAKAGNLNNAMKVTTSPYIVTLDADMIPIHDFLMVSMPYFINKDKIGFIQLPQVFYNVDIFQYNLYSEQRIPNEQDYFYRDIQIGKNSSNSVIYGGSNTILSREVLNEIGGFVTNVITEDIATGMRIQSKGYKCIAIDGVHASGLSAHDLDGIITQRSRWARGCIQTFRKHNPIFMKGLTLRQRINYVSSISYWYSGVKRLVYMLSPIMFSVFGVMVIKANIIQVIIFWVPMHYFTIKAIKTLSSGVRSLKWTNIYETIMFPVLLPVVILETFGISKMKFEVTSKEGILNSKKNILKLLIPNLIMNILTLLGVINSLKGLFQNNGATYAFVLFWLISNQYSLIMASFFILGRKKVRSTDRFSIKADAKLYNGYKVMICSTYDISEGGVSLIIDFPVYLDPNDEYLLEIKRENYICRVKVKIVHIVSISERYKYAFSITEIDENNYKQLLNILYDRPPSTPSNIVDNSIYNDIVQNISSRKRKSIPLNRKLPRIALNRDMKAFSANRKIDIKLVNFNYMYILIEVNKGYKILDIPFETTDKLKFHCELDKNLNSKQANKDKNRYIYEVKNYKKLVNTDEIKVELEFWMKEVDNLDEITVHKEDVIYESAWHEALREVTEEI